MGALSSCNRWAVSKMIPHTLSSSPLVTPAGIYPQHPSSRLQLDLFRHRLFAELPEPRVHSNLGELIIQPEYSITTALVARGETAGCRCCGELWIGIAEMRRLSAQLHGSTVVALDAERRRRSELDAAAAAAQALRAA